VSPSSAALFPDPVNPVFSTPTLSFVAMLDPQITSVIVFTSISGALIVFRCCYRLLSICKIHTVCNRTWHSDDAWMAFAMLPLAGRSACIIESFRHDPNAADAEEQIVGRKLQIPARVLYALLYVGSLSVLSCYVQLYWSWINWLIFLDPLLSFYSRLATDSTKYRRAVAMLRWFFVVSFFMIIIPTVAECRPLSM
jgi:hypothetical protein